MKLYSAIICAILSWLGVLPLPIWYWYASINFCTLSVVGYLPTGYYGKPVDIQIDDSDLENALITYSVEIWGIYNNEEIDVTNFYDIVQATEGKIIISALNVSVTTHSTSVYYTGGYVNYEYLTVSSPTVDPMDFSFESYGPECGVYTNECRYEGDIPESYIKKRTAKFLLRYAPIV